MSSTLSGQGQDRPELQKAIEEIAESGFVGVQLRVNDEQGEWVGSAGARELGQSAKPLTNGHFRIGSTTKNFVVEQRLADRIADLIARRDTLHRLADGDRALLPDRACAILDRMSGLGFGPDYVAAQREALVLARALVPKGFDDFLTQLEHRLDDPEYVDLAKRGWEAESWEPDGPRIEELATAMADHCLANPALLGNPTSLRAWTNASAQYRLINNHRGTRHRSQPG